MVFIPSTRYGSRSVATLNQPCSSAYARASRPASPMWPSTRISRGAERQHGVEDRVAAWCAARTHAPPGRRRPHTRRARHLRCPPSAPSRQAGRVPAPRVIASAMPRALNDAVGFWPSSLIQSRPTPNASASAGASIIGVHPSPRATTGSPGNTRQHAAIAPQAARHRIDGGAAVGWQAHGGEPWLSARRTERRERVTGGGRVTGAAVQAPGGGGCGGHSTGVECGSGKGCDGSCCTMACAGISLTACASGLGAPPSSADGVGSVGTSGTSTPRPTSTLRAIAVEKPGTVAIASRPASRTPLHAAETRAAAHGVASARRRESRAAVTSPCAWRGAPAGRSRQSDAPRRGPSAAGAAPVSAATAAATRFGPGGTPPPPSSPGWPGAARRVRSRPAHPARHAAAPCRRRSRTSRGSGCPSDAQA